MQVGHWVERYGNGNICWEGEYVNGKRIYKNIDFNNLRCSVHIRGNNYDTLYVGQEYPFRIISSGVHPSDLRYNVMQEKIFNVFDFFNDIPLNINQVDDDNFDFEFTPTNAGIIYICINSIFNNKGICAHFFYVKNKKQSK